MKKTPLLALVALLFLSLPLSGDCDATSAAESRLSSRDDLFSSGRQSLGIAGGYGTALPFRQGSDREVRNVQYAYIAPRWGIGLSNPLGGSSWYRGNVELVLEGSFFYIFEPKGGFAGGFTPLFRYNFLAGRRLVPFLEGGAGVVALDADLREQADGFNFTPQAGVGLHYFLTERTALTGEFRYLHVSNAGIHERNRGIDSTLFLLGITIFLR
jgi:hypothetical protein